MFINGSEYSKDFHLWTVGDGVTSVPRELVLPPDELFETEESRYFLEYSLLYGWMRQCLNYLKWYHLTALSPWVTLEELFSGPVVSHSWRMVAVDEDLVRFSLEVVYRSALFKCINQAVK
ncbi:hypothetical protein E3N88_25902 [Mikania micrantha]|uniref:Uncharacterized protein n=1 Tax=Mikania micrantha TaxID=192012 RepID=A0A5N6N7S2_9ASTR|nr:hypothetical protein E3N88_25902 [Mikania micrantha]